MLLEDALNINFLVVELKERFYKYFTYIYSQGFWKCLIVGPTTYAKVNISNWTLFVFRQEKLLL